jgi:hypothetical protein
MNIKNIIHLRNFFLTSLLQIIELGGKGGDMGKRKTRSFVDKVAKGTGPRGTRCEICGEIIKNIKTIRPYKSKSGNWRYIEEMHKVCKCNEKEILIDKSIS